MLLPFTLSMSDELTRESPNVRKATTGDNSKL